MRVISLFKCLFITVGVVATNLLKSSQRTTHPYLTYAIMRTYKLEKLSRIPLSLEGEGWGEGDWLVYLPLSHCKQLRNDTSEIVSN